MANKMKRLLGIAMAAVLCTASVVPALADGEPVVTDEAGLTITTTTEVSKEGGNTVTVTFEEWNNAGDENAEIAIEGEETTTVTDNSKQTTTVVDGEETQTWIEEDDGNEAGQVEVEVELVRGEKTDGTANEVTVTDNIPGGSTEDNSDITITTTTDRTVTADTSDVEVNVNDSNSGLVEDEASGLVGIMPEYDETDGAIKDAEGKDGLFDRNYLSSHTLDYICINGVSIWVDKGSKTIVDIVAVDGAELPDHALLNGIAVGSNVSKWYPTSNTFKKSLFPEGTIYKGGAKTNDINNWYDKEDNLVVTIPPEGEYRYVGTGEHSKYFSGIVKVIYLKDENGNTVYDENGQPIIEKLVNNVSGADHTSNGEVLDEIPEEWEVDSGFSGSRAQNFMLMDANGNRVYAYCCDVQTGVVAGTWYSVANLEDSEYYTPEAEEHIRSIAMNGYWGTSDIPDENGEYKFGSLESIKAKMLAAIERGEIERYVQVPVRDTSTDGAGKIQVDENGDPIYYEEKMDLMEIIAGMTEGEALLATQAAIWSFANGSQGASSGIDGPAIITPDWYRNHQIGYSKVEGEPLDDAAGVRVTALYNWLMNLDTEEESTVVINEKNFVEDMSLVVGDKAEGHANNADEDKDNDVYNTSIKFNLAFVPDKDSDDLLVYLTDANGDPIKGADGNPIIRRLAGSAKEGETYGAITPEEDGSYILTGLQLEENSDFTFDLRLEGTQYLEKGVYVYSAVGGRDVSQTFVGVAEGERNVDVSLGVTVTFDVDEDNKVVAERKWHSTSVRRKSTSVNEDPADPGDPGLTVINEAGVPLAASADGLVVEILDEEVPLADAPATGDNSIVYVLMSLISLCGLSLMVMKRKEAKEN